MKNLIRTAAAIAALTVTTLAQAGVPRSQDLACEYARAALETASRRIETELRDNLNVDMPELRIEQADEFGVDHSSNRAETHATTSTSRSTR